MEQNNNNSLAGRIELNWPGKHSKLEFIDGKWHLTPFNKVLKKRALMYESTIGKDEQTLGYCVKGDTMSVLDSLHAYISGGIRLIYMDAPRLNAFQALSESGYGISTWLSLIQQTAKQSSSLLMHNGFIAIHTDEQMAHYVRIVLDEVYGQSRYVGTFAWQKQYAPQNDHRIPTDVFDYITVYSKLPVNEIEKIGILVTPKDLKDDGDFRGCYIDGHKGARSGSEATKFKVNTSPYHWEIIESNLPEGNYYFDKILGSLWFESANSTGNFFVRVRAIDKKGQTDEKTIKFAIRESQSIDDDYQLPTRIWWLLKNDNDIVKGGQLSIVELAEKQLVGIKGQEFSLVFKAKGGEPFTMKNDSPGSGRYWEFGLRTLIEGVARAKVSFGNNGTALPSIKKYFDRNDAKKRQAVMNFLPWYDFGDTQDATQHCKALKAAGITEGTVDMMAKPQKLLSHLISLFAPNSKDIVLSIGDTNGVFASVAMKSRHRFIHFAGINDDEMNAWKLNASKRMLATSDGQDVDEIEGNDALGNTNPKKGHIDVLRLSDSYLTCDTRNGDIEPYFSDNESVEDFYAGLAGSYRVNSESDIYYGIDNRTVIVVPFEEPLDSIVLDQLKKKYPSNNLVVVYETAVEQLTAPQKINIRHAPFELI